MKSNFNYLKKFRNQMSHFTKIKTSLKDLSLLKISLTDLRIVWDSSVSSITGYNAQSYFVNLVLKQTNGYDIGFAWNGVEYQLVTDLQFWQQPWSVDIFLDKLTQRYAYNSILKATKEKGFEAVEEISEIDGSIKLTLQRWR
jgi:hypothetical protein